MNSARLKPLVHRPSVVIAGLTVIAILAFVSVGRLASRFREQQKALARRLYARGLDEQRSGHSDLAIEDFRTALGYNRDEFQYQLSLARALRDTGRTDEAEAYLVSLWERAPQDGAVNLALGRLAAREGTIDKAIQYYHNAIYGVWGPNQDANRRNARFELIDFLLGKGARPQAEAELITLAAELPPDPALELRAAQLLIRAQDYERALKQYQKILQREPSSTVALAGAGEAAFRLGRYRAACAYLRTAAASNPQDAQTQQLLETCNLILQADPSRRGLSNAERRRRLRAAFDQAGQRLASCASSQAARAADPSVGAALASLKSDWMRLKPRVEASATTVRADTADTAMDLVFQIEQQTQQQCGPPAGLDQALLLLSQVRGGVDR
ncbi:MAG: tetratricopeptide repeat protein [Acidobacteriia bacterium]|nr:tetratricopeptide repeat protein [Terriglobia bacterium]